MPGEVKGLEATPALAPASPQVDSAPSAEWLLHHDELTGLYNRRFYSSRMAAEAQRAAAEGLPLAFLLVDLDYFKSINDRYGHSVGDRVLERVGGRMIETVGDGGFPIRYAGDEFCVLAPGVGREAALALAQRLVEAVRAEPVELPDGAPPLTVTLSVGVACYPDGTDDPQALFDHADRAVYVAKKRGRNQAAPYEPEQAQLLDRVSLFRQFPCPKLVDRADLMGRLLQHLFPAVDRRLAIVTLQGPSGVGKSRLLHDLKDQADPQRLMVLLAGGLPYLASQPFGYLIEALGRAIRQDPRLGQAMAVALNPADRLAVARLLPELSRHTLLDASSGEEDRAELPRAFAEMLLAMAREKRLILLLDDFQWVDPGTLATLTLLCETADRNSMAVLVAMRADSLNAVSDDEASAREEALWEFIGRMMRSNHLAGFPVPPLSRKGVAEMVAAIMPSLAGDQALQDLVWEKSGGLPLLVEEILRYLILRDCIAAAEDGRTLRFTPPREEIPSTAELLQKFQTDQLADEVRAPMARMATLGNEFGLEEARALEAMDEGRLRDVLEKAKSQRLILERWENDVEKFEFVSQGAREALFSSLDPDERKRMHARIAEMKERQYQGVLDSALADLAFHFSQAGDREKAEKYAALIETRYHGYAARSDVVMVGRTPDARSAASTRRLSEEELRRGLDLARQFRVVARTGRMYGPEAEQVRDQVREFHNGLMEFLAEAESLDFSQAGNSLLINGSPLPPAARAGGLNLILENAQVKALSFNRGVSPAEVETLVRALLLKREQLEDHGGLGKFLKDHGAQHIVPNEKIYVHVAEQDILLKRRDSDEAVIVKDLDSMRREFEPGAFVESDLDEDTAELVRSQVPGAGRAEGGPSGGGSSRAASLEGQTPMEREELLRLQSEIRAWYEELNKYIDLTFMEAVSGDWKVLCKDLESGNRLKIAAACKAFMERGQDSADPLLSFAALTDDPRARKIALHMVGKLVPDASERLVQRIVGTREEDEIVRLIRATEDVPASDSMAQRLEPFVHHGHSQVREAAIQALARMNWRLLEKALLEALERKTDLGLRVDTVQALGVHEVLSAREKLIPLCKRRSIFFPEEDSRLQEAVCVALGRMRGDETVRVLSGALARTGGFWRTKPPVVRAAAAVALGHACGPGDHAVHALLEKNARDRDPMVRSACKVALGLCRGDVPAPAEP